jgi:tetratricopeptide (TPR) repeat protein
MHGVTFLESDINRNGGKFLLVAGAPVSAGDDDDRLLRAVHAIVSSQGRLTLRAGVNHGRVFSGDFGPDFRRTFSVKGDAVNVAARVMGRAAAGTVVATELVMARARTTFAVEHLDPFMVKGKSEPISAVALGAPQDAHAPAHGLVEPADDTFVGRGTELATIHAVLERARRRLGSVVEVVGEPGLGKSRLIEEALRDAGDFVIVRGPSASYESRTPYFAFRHLLRDILGLRSSHDVEATAARLTARVEVNAPQLIPWLPLLSVVLDADLPPTRETLDLDERFRGAKLEEVLVDFLRLVLPTPAVLVFENTHLMDDASADLLSRVESEAENQSWAVVMTRRDLDSGHRSAGTSSHYRALPLTPIASAEALDLLEAATRATPLSAKAMEAIAAKADGNPLFLRALVGAASRARTEDELPDSIEGVLTSEVDRLPPEARTLLRYAAVLGVRFSELMLREVLAAGGHDVYDIDLGRLRGFLQPEGDGGWRFQHALVRDVAYAGLPYRLRRVMHQRAGSVLEATSPSLEEVSERLSLHFFHAADFERAWTYSRMAGRRAQSLNAHRSAIEFFERAIEAGRSCGAPRSDLGEVVEELGDVCDVAGLSRDAVAAYRRARPYRSDDALRRAGLLLKEAGLHQRLGSFVTSLRLLTHARTILRDTGGPVVEAARSRLATRYAFGTYLQGDYARALRWSEEGMREAQSSGDTDALAYAYNTRHLACIHAGVVEEEPYGELALAAYEAAGDLRMQAHCLNNLAIGAMHDGEWNESAELLDRAADMFRRVGDTANEANAQYNRADLLIRQRRFAEAEPLLYVALREAYAADDGLSTRELGRVLVGLGRADGALPRFEAARAAFTDLGLAQELLGLDEAVAECFIQTGDIGLAIELAADALARADELGHDNVLAALHRVHGFALLAANRRDEARTTFEAGVISPNAGDGRRDYALILLGFAELDAVDQPDDAALMRDESRRILDALGVQTEALLI